MADNFPKNSYTKGDVRRAGEALAGTIEWNDDASSDVKQTFEIAYSWIDAHLEPMKIVRSELSAKIRQLHLKGMTAARLKRMRSIRKKLNRIKTNLHQIQDLAGCRAILPSMVDVKRLIDSYRTNSRHKFIREYDYISKPKPDGYRSYHIILKYKERKQFEPTDFQVELQIRTRLQHSWATAVEAIGVYLSQDLKGGEGDPDWRRLFELMASELAVAENCPILEGAPQKQERLIELKSLNKKLDAVTKLEAIKNAMKYTQTYIYDKAKYFLIHYDKTAQVVRVDLFQNSADAVNARRRIEQMGSRYNAVLIEADKIESLKDLYPNYFGDVHIFTQNFRDIIKGKGAKEYTIPPQQISPANQKVVPDTSWYKRVTRPQIRVNKPMRSR